MKSTQLLDEEFKIFSSRVHRWCQVGIFILKTDLRATAFRKGTTQTRRHYLIKKAPRPKEGLFNTAIDLERHAEPKAITISRPVRRVVPKTTADCRRWTRVTTLVSYLILPPIRSAQLPPCHAAHWKRVNTKEGKQLPGRITVRIGHLNQMFHILH